MKYLLPKIFRIGNPILSAVEKKKEDGSYWLITFSEINRPKKLTTIKSFRGVGSDYDHKTSTRISRRLYKTFISEARENRMKCKEKSK